MTEKKFNILEHELVPEHMILSKEEAKEVLDKYNAKAEQLPKILSTDPAIKAIGAKKGDIIKIIRKSKTAKKAIAYRVVIEEGTTMVKESLKK